MPIEEQIGSREEKSRTQTANGKKNIDSNALENFKESCKALNWQVPGLQAPCARALSVDSANM